MKRAAIAALLALACEEQPTARAASALFHADETVYFHGGLGAGTTLTTNQAGAVVEERRSEPFGEPIDAFRPDYGVTVPSFEKEPHNALNKETDRHTGFSYHGARWMAPQSSRWLSPDPAVVAPRKDALLSPASLHPYQYAEQRPTSFWDPDGASPADTDGIWRAGQRAAALQNHPITSAETREALGAMTNPLLRGYFYMAAHRRLQEQEGAIKTNWFRAAAYTAGPSGVPAAIDTPGVFHLFFNTMVDSNVKDFLRTGNEFLFVHNRGNYELLKQGKEIPGLEGLRGKDLDKALVVFEQTTLQHFIDDFKQKNPATWVSVQYRLNSLFNTSMTVDPITKSIVKGRLGGAFDFGSLSDRVTLGFELIDRIEETPK